MEKLNISILYVEDEDYIRNNMVISLQRRVKTIYSAANGSEGLELFKKYSPDLVITDIRMPVMTGLEMIKEIRRYKDSTKIIMLSAHSDTQSLLDSIETGVNGYMLKPFQTKKLFNLIEEQASVIILDKKVKEQSKRINELYTSLMKDIETAGSVQEYLLPDHLIVKPELFFTSTYVPSTKIGGDLFDIIHISESEYICYIGDISGHGVKAALLMTAVKTTINRIIEDEKLLEPHQILNRLSTILTRELFSGDYMTLLLCYVNCRNKSIKLLNAGHPPLIIYNKKEKTVTTYQPEGSIPIGWIANYVYTPDEENEIEFSEDQIIFLYTDGLFECENPRKEELGITGLTELISKGASTTSVVNFPFAIRDAMIAQHYDISSDDFTLVAFNLIPTAENPDSERLFSGELSRELQQLSNKAASFAQNHLQDEILAEALDKNLKHWLQKELVINKEYHDLENYYLAELRLGNDEENCLNLKLWAKHLDLCDEDALDTKGILTSLLSEQVKLETKKKQYKGFNELNIKISRQKV